VVLVDPHEPVRVAVRQRLQQHAPNQAEDDGVRADADRQCRHHDGREPVPPNDSSPRLANVGRQDAPAAHMGSSVSLADRWRPTTSQTASRRPGDMNGLPDRMGGDKATALFAGTREPLYLRRRSLVGFSCGTPQPRRRVLPRRMRLSRQPIPPATTSQTAPTLVCWYPRQQSEVGAAVLPCPGREARELERSDDSGAEGYRFEPYRAYHSCSTAGCARFARWKASSTAGRVGPEGLRVHAGGLRGYRRCFVPKRGRAHAGPKGC
jgi:hypothetical protein